MKISNVILDCVVFICFYNHEKASYVPLGTGVIIGDTDKENNPSYILTAKHIINGIKNKKAGHIFIKVNIKNGFYGILKTKYSCWVNHKSENVDAAILPISWSLEIDQKAFPFKHFIDEEKIHDLEINIGDETIVTGLFHHHYGKNKNLPIVRVGNISYIGNEKIQTKEHNMAAILIECRSIGGISGSPVFINVGNHRTIKGKLVTNYNESVPLLLGIIYGHYDQIDGELALNEDGGKINTGIAIVTPIKSIKEIFGYPEIKFHQKNIENGIFESGIDFTIFK